MKKLTSSRLDRSLLRAFLAGLAGISLCMAILNLNWSLKEYSARKGVVLPSGIVSGGDFIALYCGGKLFSETPEKLYDYEAQYECEKSIIADGQEKPGFLAFVYPPLVAAGFSLLSKLAFLTAQMTWALVSFCLGAFFLILLLRSTALGKLEQLLLALALLGFQPFLVECLHGGQTSALGLSLLVATYLLLVKGKDFFAGIAFSFSYYKPPLFFLLLLSLAKDRGRNFIWGFLISGTLLAFASIATLGVSGIWQFFLKASSYTYGNEFMPGHMFIPRKAAGVFPLSSMILPENLLLAKCLYFAVLLLTFLYAYRSKFMGKGSKDYPVEYPLRFALQVTFSLCFSIQMIVYDLSLLFVPIVLVCSDIYQHKVSGRAALVMAAIALLFLEFSLRDVQFGGLNLNAAAPAHLLFLLALITYAKERSSLKM